MGLGGIVTSLWTFWLFGDEWSGVTIINLLAPTHLGSTGCGQRMVNFFPLMGVSVSAKQLKGHGSECYLEPLKVRVSHTVVSYFLWPHGPTNLLCPWDFPRQEYWRGLPFPSPGNFPTQGSSPGLLHCGQILYPYVCMCVLVTQLYLTLWPHGRKISLNLCNEMLLLRLFILTKCYLLRL